MTYEEINHRTGMNQTKEEREQQSIRRWVSDKVVMD